MGGVRGLLGSHHPSKTPAPSKIINLNFLVTKGPQIMPRNLEPRGLGFGVFRAWTLYGETFYCCIWSCHLDTLYLHSL